MTAIDWTAIGTVSLSVLTFLTLVVSVVLARANFTGLQKVQEQVDQNRKLINIEEKRDLQAYKISGWLSVSENNGDLTEFPRRFNPNATLSSAEIKNGSNQPIYEVTGSFWNLETNYNDGRHRHIDSFDLGTIPPGAHESVPISWNYRGEQIASYKSIFGENKNGEFSKWLMKPVEISFRFRDSEEVWWERTVKCRMERITLEDIEQR